jgi:hypothetical protein
LVMYFRVRFIIIDDNGPSPAGVPRRAGSPQGVASLHQLRPASASEAPLDCPLFFECTRHVALAKAVRRLTHLGYA